MNDRLKIDKEELFTPAVEEALAHEKALKRQRSPEPPPLSPLRRVLYNSMFYLPVAAGLLTFVAWLIVEPYFDDTATVGGEVVMVNNEPFGVTPGVISFTVGDKEVLASGGTTLAPGVGGNEKLPAYASLSDIKQGDIIEAVGDAPDDNRIFAFAIRPSDQAHAAGLPKSVRSGAFIQIFYFAVIALFISLGLLVSEGLSSRNWIRMVERSLLGSFLGMLFSGIASIFPGNIIMAIAQHFALQPDNDNQLVITVHSISAGHFITHVVGRSIAWACVGAALGVGINLVRSSKTQIRNAVLGGTLGGALGGALFDPIDRFARSSLFEQSDTSRLAGFLVLGVSIGIFVALVERLAREAWLRVRTGPLAGKSFILYRTPTQIGSSPTNDIYLFKDAEIDATHAAIHRVGSAYEIEDLGSRMGTQVGGQAVRRRRLASGNQIIIGNTVLEFEERAKRAS